jgi:hypothetical protein
VSTPGQSTLAAAIGGPRGLFDSGLPALVFVLGNAAAGLRAGIVAALAVAVGLVALRTARGQPVQQAVSGVFAVAVAAFVAARTGKAEGFFLPGIAISAIYGGVALVSVLVGRPLAGYLLAAFDPRYADWREHPRLRRAAALATLVWVAVFGLRTAVQGALYLAGSVGWLAVAKIAMGYPLTALAVLVTIALVRRARPTAHSGPASDPPPSSAAS